RRIAETAVSMVPWPEIITTGRFGCSFLISSRSASPSSRDPCNQMSRKTRRGTRSAIAARALSASWAVRVSWPSPSRMPATSSRMSSSSSTIRMSDAIFNLFVRLVVRRVCRRQHDADHGPPASVEGFGSVVQFKSPTMVFHDLLDDREAEAGPFFAGRHIGLEQPLAVLARQALAIVDNVHGDVF